MSVKSPARRNACLYLGQFLVERVLEGVGRGVVDADTAVAVDGVRGADAGAAGGAAEAAVTTDAAACGAIFAVGICSCDCEPCNGKVAQNIIVVLKLK